VFIAGELAQVAVEQAKLVVAEGAAGQRKALGLLDQRRADARMTVPLVDGAVGAQAVHVAVAFDVPHPHALAATQHHVERLVVVRPVLVFQSD
jgi:hypothetical protein